MSERDIAIIGMAGRFPGAPNVERYWDNLRDGVSSIRALSEAELLAAGVTRAELDDPAYVRVCPVLDGVEEFDAAFFGLSPRDASVMDPAHRIFLEVAWEALENAGHAGLPGDGAVGVFATSGAPYYLMDNVRRNSALMQSMGEFLARHTNNDMNFLATRVSYEMDLRGPSINIQTACSSALVAVHMACDSIRRGECDMALAGGSTVNIPHAHGYLYREGEILSPDGVCRPFDAGSAGTVFGSGSGCVVLKALSRALDDGDSVLAVIKGSAINNDGAMRVGFLAPGVDGQAAVVRRAVEVAGVAADSISYVETHGTGTSVGDPIEVEALKQAHLGATDRRGYCGIGSVKSNIGHLGEAAGIASLIKVVLSLQHRQLPPSLGFETPNPLIGFDDSPFFVNGRLREWTGEGRLRCGVTALGAGGTNCHVIVEEAPARIAGEGEREAQLFTLSARTSAALEIACDNLADALEDDEQLDLADAAYTLSVGRRPMRHRAAFVARGRAEAIERLRTRDPKRVAMQSATAQDDSVVFMFPGGGAQYARMGAELYETEATYRDAIDDCLAIIEPRIGRDLGALMFPAVADVPAASREMERPSLSLPALFATEYALARLFESWGVEPTAYLGHSMGEYVAACLSGVMGLEDALAVVMLRGRLFETVPPGRMLSVPMGEAALRAIMPPGLDIAAVNAPELCVASGPESLIQELEAVLAARQVEATRVRIDVAAHSAMLEPVLDEFRDFLRAIELHPPRVPFPSNVTGTWITATEATDPEYWVRHLRSTVRFADCLATVRLRGDGVLLELGPGRTLSTLARAQRTPAPYAFHSVRHRDEVASDLEYALSALGKVWSAGAPVDWSALYDGQLRNRIALPTYPWEHQRHWIDAPVNVVPVPAAAPGPLALAVPDDGRRRENVNDWFARPTWRQSLPIAPLTHAEETALVFCDAEGVGDGIADRLVGSGRRVIRVRAGSAWAQAGDVVTIRPDVPAELERLMAAFSSLHGGRPRRIVHCWGITGAARTAPLTAILSLGFHSLLHLGRILSSDDESRALSLCVVTDNLQRVAGETFLDPAKALLLGPTRVMQQEVSGLTACAIDIVLPAQGSAREALLTSLAPDVVGGSDEETIAYRGRERFVQTQDPVRLDRLATRLRQHGVYLITGGLGGLGLTVARHLAATYAARLVLIGRGATGQRTASQVAELTALGAQVEVVQADVTSVEQMREAVARAHSRFGGLHGVFHAAGVLGDSLMALKSAEDADRVIAPKVQGTMALDAAIGDTPLDVFVLFSSVSSVAGLAGQADYTAANAFLDAFAAERNTRSDTFTVSINWSAWRDVGMVANIASAAGSASVTGDEVHPLLGRTLWDSAEGRLFTQELAVHDQWVLAEHRLRGAYSLMPGTGHLEIARAALTTGAEARTLEMRDIAFISALVVHDAAPREMRVRVAAVDGGAWRFVIAGRVDDGSLASGWQEHVTGRGAYVDDAPPPALDVVAVSARCSVREQTVDGVIESSHMDFGERWSNLRSIRYGIGEAFLTLALPDEFVADLPAYQLHPAMMDLATGASCALVPGFDAARDFYVPLSYTRLRVFGALPQRIHSHVRLVSSDFASSDVAVFDVTITDATGRVLVDIEEFMMSRVIDVSQLEGGESRAGTRRPSAAFDPPGGPGIIPPVVRRLEDSIRTDEGLRALETILAGPALSQVFATPQPLGELIADLRQPTAPVIPIEAAVVAAPVTRRFPDTELRLREHPGVADAIVVERFDRPGKRHVVGYVLPRPDEHPTASELRRLAKKQLPADQVPGVILLVESLPLDATGAPDLSALHDPFALADDHIAPRTPTEQTIAGIWKDALGVERIGVRDNFFDIGGHSLLAVRAIVRIDRAVGVRLNQAIMVMQTLEQVAAEVDRQLGEQTRAGAATSPTAAKPAGEGPTEQGGRGFLRSLRNAVVGKGS